MSDECEVSASAAVSASMCMDFESLQADGTWKWLYGACGKPADVRKSMSQWAQHKREGAIE